MVRYLRDFCPGGDSYDHDLAPGTVDMGIILVTDEPGAAAGTKAGSTRPSADVEFYRDFPLRVTLEINCVSLKQEIGRCQVG